MLTQGTRGVPPDDLEFASAGGASAVSMMSMFCFASVHVVRQCDPCFSWEQQSLLQGAKCT